MIVYTYCIIPQSGLTSKQESASLWLLCSLKSLAGSTAEDGQRAYFSADSKIILDLINYQTAERQSV